MKNIKHCFKTNKHNKAGFILGAAFLATMTCAQAQNVGITVSPPVVVVPAAVIQDDYLYYPNYGVYYNSGRHQYAYLQGDTWVSTPAPRGVSVDVLTASPSVRMDWHDSPAKHHSDMQKRYPRNWKSSDEHQERK